MSRIAPRPLESICGMWKRCLQTRMLDDFALDQDDNILVSIEKVDSHPQTSKLRFSFGKSPDSMRTGYSVEPIIDPTVGAPRVVPLRVSYSGQDCFVSLTVGCRVAEYWNTCGPASPGGMATGAWNTHGAFDRKRRDCQREKEDARQPQARAYEQRAGPTLPWVRRSSTIFLMTIRSQRRSPS